MTQGGRWLGSRRGLPALSICWAGGRSYERCRQARHIQRYIRLLLHNGVHVPITKSASGADGALTYHRIGMVIHSFDYLRGESLCTRQTSSSLLGVSPLDLLLLRLRRRAFSLRRLWEDAQVQGITRRDTMRAVGAALTTSIPIRWQELITYALSSSKLLALHIANHRYEAAVHVAS